MLTLQDLNVSFGERTLFKDVNLKFLPGNCYGLIGANGAGKSTLLKVISGDIESTSGSINMGKGERLAMLKQDQFAHDDQTVLDTIMSGYAELYAILQEREALYSKADFTEEDGMRSADLEMAMADMNGYEAESEAAVLLNNLGIAEELHSVLMSELEAGQKVRVLLAQSLFGNPDILLLDEPTNQLDLGTISWLEDFLANFQNTVIVVSHDRHFLNNVSTHIVDIDFNKIRMYVGNYDFWYQASQLVQQQLKNQKLRSDDKIQQLEGFIRRFSANASKSKQATARKNMIDKLKVEELPQSSRRFPFVDFRPERSTGKVVLTVEDLNLSVDGEHLLKDFNLNVNPEDKIAFIGPNDLVKTILFEAFAGERQADSGSIMWGSSITSSWFPKENSEYFDKDVDLVEWLRQYSTDESESYVRSFLGRMLFSGDDVFKSAMVLSGGEKVRCMLSRCMLSGANVLVMDEPTNHLDLESITALNDGLIKFPGVVLFTSHDFQFIDTIANRIVEIAPGGIIDRHVPLSEYLKDERVLKMRQEYYMGEKAINI
ncbi:MAG: ATPase subunit of ABC transporter with duplicated ATPase domains [Cellvibrionaceae bacterium]|jgi:ATPase subunit of ABC transporter with duplicated ATPase domains